MADDFERDQGLSSKFGGGIFGTGTFSRKKIVREVKTSDNFTRKQGLSSKFGGGIFGTGTFSRTPIEREKKT